MILNVTGKNFDITPEVKEFIETKLHKLKDYLQKLTNNKIIISQEAHKNMYTAEIELHLDGFIFFAKSTSSNWRDAINVAVDKIEKEITKKMKKIQDHKNTIHRE